MATGQTGNVRSRSWRYWPWHEFPSTALNVVSGVITIASPVSLVVLGSMGISNSGVLVATGGVLGLAIVLLLGMVVYNRPKRAFYPIRYSEGREAKLDFSSGIHAIAELSCEATLDCERSSFAVRHGGFESPREAKLDFRRASHVINDRGCEAILDCEGSCFTVRQNGFEMTMDSSRARYSIKHKGYELDIDFDQGSLKFGSRNHKDENILIRVETMHAIISALLRTGSQSQRLEDAGESAGNNFSLSLLEQVENDEAFRTIIERWITLDKFTRFAVMPQPGGIDRFKNDSFELTFSIRNSMLNNGNGTPLCNGNGPLCGLFTGYIRSVLRHMLQGHEIEARCECEPGHHRTCHYVAKATKKQTRREAQNG
jgi:hypothetical protein